MKKRPLPPGTIKTKPPPPKIPARPTTVEGLARHLEKVSSTSPRPYAPPPEWNVENAFLFLGVMNDSFFLDPKRCPIGCLEAYVHRCGSLLERFESLLRRRASP